MSCLPQTVEEESRSAGVIPLFNKLSILSRHFPHLHSFFLYFHYHHGDSIHHSVAVGTEGRYLVMLVEVVGLAMPGLGFLVVA